MRAEVFNGKQPVAVRRNIRRVELAFRCDAFDVGKYIASLCGKGDKYDEIIEFRRDLFIGFDGMPLKCLSAYKSFACKDACRS